MHGIWPHEDVEQFRRASAPENEVPAVVPVSAVLARNDTSALTLTGVQVFSSGISFTLALRCRPEALPVGEADLGELMWRGHRGRDTALLIGVEFADGRRASNLAGRDPFSAPGGPEDVVFTQGSGSGQQLTVEEEWWLSPLPPGGPLRVVARCDLLGLPETVTEFDGAAIRAAADDVVVLWPWVSPSVAEPPEPAPPDLPADSWFAGS